MPESLDAAALDACLGCGFVTTALNTLGYCVPCQLEPASYPAPTEESDHGTDPHLDHLAMPCRRAM